MPLPPTAKMKSTSTIKYRQTIRGHTDWVTGVAHLPDGRRTITCSPDGSLRLWNIESGVQIGNAWRDHGKEEVWSIALSPNGKTVASGCSDGKIRLWDIHTKAVVARWTGHTDFVWSLCWSVDGKRVVSGSHDGMIRVWDVDSGDTILGPVNTGHRYVSAVIYSPDTTKIATSSGYENALKIWDAKTGNLLSTIEHDCEVWSLAWTSDQKKLISGSNDGSIRIFNTATWQQIAVLEGHKNIVFSLSLLQNDRLLASASYNKTVRLWDLDTYLSVGPPLQHQACVQCAAILADGKLLVTGCRDKRVYVWNIHAILKDAGLEELISNLNESTQQSSAYSLQDLTDHIQGRSNYPIASGGFGDIWKCVLVKPDGVVEVAVKTIRTFELDDEASVRKKSRRVRRELKVWGRLKHDCILPLWGVASNFGPYPAMICPWVLNGALTGFLMRQQDTLSSQDKFSLLNDIAHGLQYLHSKSIIHGDLTGSNVLVQGNGRACLADFGLSTMVQGFINPSYFTGTTNGNVRWAAAELFEVPKDGDDDNTVVSLTIECDIYSFGSIALQVLTCKVPYYYVEKDLLVIGHVIQGKKPQPPKESQIEPLHWAFIQRCRLSRASRPTAAEVVAFIACERCSSRLT